MVLREMATRRTPLLAFIAVWSMFVVSVAVSTMHETRSASNGPEAVVRVRTHAPVVSVDRVAPREHGRLVPLPGSLRGAVVALAISVFLLAGIVGPWRRRTADDGDRWRGLLSGAPPSAA